MAVPRFRTASLEAPTVQPWVPYDLKPKRWWPDVLLGLFILGWTAALMWHTPLVDLDIAIRDLSDDHRPSWAYWIARVSNFAGQGGPLSVICLAIACWVVYRTRTIRPLLPMGATYAVLVAVLFLKDTTDRVAPHFPGEEPYVDAAGSLVFGAGGEPNWSYPSGHAVNTVVWYVLLVMYLGDRMSRRLRMLVLVAPPIIGTVAMTYLSFHWLSDAPPGIALGILVARNLYRIPWPTIPLPKRLDDLPVGKKRNDA